MLVTDSMVLIVIVVVSLVALQIVFSHCYLTVFAVDGR